MILDPELGTGVAFDNFDRFVETLSGKDTLHDTVGIVYQTIRRNNDTRQEEANTGCEELLRVDHTKEAPRKKRRRTFEPTCLDIEPYRKRPKMLKSAVLPINDPKRVYVPDVRIKARMWDSLWMMEFCFWPANTPMWVGWNSKQIPNSNEIQKVWYVPQINQSPTSVAVAAETLKRAQIIVEECRKKTISVTFDLAIEKIALQLQPEESPKFNNVFVALGPFHIELAMFGAFGKYVAELGGPHVLNEGHVVEKDLSIHS